MKLLEGITKLREERDALKKRIQESAKSLLTESTSELFAKHPKLESFSWTQYTPYFNDGEECVFRVSNDYLPIKFNGEEYEEVSDWTFNPKNRYREEARNVDGLKEAYQDIRRILDALETEDYKDMFGDHVEVTVSREGVSVDEYSHD